MTELAQKLIELKKRIQLVEDACGLKKGHTQLVCVTKSRPIDDVQSLYSWGQRHFAENRVQEALLKINAFKYPDIHWHFIGPIQSNKTKLIAQNFSWIQSLDSSAIATRLNRQRPNSKPPINVLIQVNISKEEQKSGVKPEEVDDLAKDILSLPQLKWRGLMGMTSQDVSRDEKSRQFKSLKDLFDKLSSEYSEAKLDTLSMGMSDDWSIALENHSSMLRIGRLMF